MKKLDFLPNLRNRYSIRRFTVGTASILIGSLLFLGHNGEAKAAESTNDNTVVEASKDTSTSQQEPVENTVPQDKTTDTIQQAGNTQTTSNVLETVKTDALSKLSTFTHLTEETVKQYTAEVKQAQTEADVQAVVDKAQKAEAEAVKQAEAEQTKTFDSTKEQSAATTEVPKSTTESVKEETKADTTSATTSETNNTSEAKTVTSTDQATPTIESTPLSTEQKVDKVKTELASDYDSSKVDAALAVIDTTDLTEDQIKAEVLKLLLEQGSAQKDLYSPQATKLRSAVEEPTTAVRTFSVDTSLKNKVVVTPENFNQYFFLVDDAYYDPSSGTATLTQNWPSQKGSISLDTKMNVNKDFHFSGWINLGDKYEGHPKVGAPGGDGIAFIFNPGNTHELGLYGSALGVGGLKYAFGFKLDTYVNTQYDPKGKAKPDPAQFNKVGAFGAFVFADSTGGAYNLQQVKLEQFTYTAAALLEEDFVDTDLQELIDRPLRTSGDVDKIITVQDHNAYLAEKGYKFVSEDTSYAPTYDAAKKTIKLTNASQFLVYYVKDIEAPKIGDIVAPTVDVNTAMTPLVLDITDNSKHLKTKTVTGLPAGVTFDEATNTISGTPTAVGTSTITVTATDHAGLSTTKTFTYTVVDTKTPDVTFVVDQTTEAYTPMTPINVNAEDNSKVAPTLAVTGLPTGLSFDPTTKQITGTPTTVGTSTVTVSATDGSTNIGTSTFNIVVTPNTALEALKAAVADAKTVNKNDYTPNSVAALDAKLTEAEALIAHPENGSTDQFNAKTQEVKQAKDQLVRKADKTDLEKAIAEASKYTNLNPTKPMDQQLITALANAKNTDADQNATQKAVDDSKNSLNNAIQEKLRADAYEKLQQAVMRGVQVAKTDGYTPNSLQAVKDTIQKVNPLVTASMSDDSTVRKQYTVEQIEQATKDINDSISGLVRQADKTELQKAIDKAGTLGTLNPADTEDKAVQDKLAAANTVKADGNATKAQVDQATADLNKAIDQKLYQDALDRLNAAIKDAKGVNQADYTPASVTPFDAAIKAGEAKAADKTATPEQLDAVAKAITDAKAQLQHNADKSALEAAINKAKALGALNEADAEDKAVKDALTAGEGVKDNANATTQQVADATKAINDAIAAKEHADALDALKAKLAEVKALDKAPFTPDSVNALNAQVTAGDTVVAAEKSKTTEEIKAATKALTDAQKALVKQADKTELEKAIAKAGTLGQLNAADTEDKAVQDALAKANQVKADGNATPQQVAEATDTLNKAIDKKLYQDALDELNAAIRDAEAVTKANYTPETVTPFEKAVTDGKAKAADSNATPEQLKAAAQAIKTAKDALKQKANKAELEKSIATAEALQPLKAGDPEDDAVKAALDKAKQVDANQNADQAAVDAAKVELDNAIKAKQTQDAADAKQAALDALKAELEKAKAINKDEYTPNSVKPLTDAETTGQAIVDAPDNKTTAEIEAATQALKDAQAGLVAKADKAELDKAITTADGLNLDPTDKEDKAVQDALEKAKAVQANPNATQDEVNAAKDALNKAIEAKTAQDKADAKQAALDELKAELAKVAKIDLNQYTPDSVKPLTDKEIEGNAIVAIPDAKTTEEIKAVTQALKDAQAGLVQKADKAELQKAIDAANALGNLDAADKEDKALQDAVAVGEKVKADGNATPQQVADATKAINDAIAAKEHQDALDELQKAIDAANAINKDDFKPNTVKPLEDAVAAGEAAKADATKTPEELKEAAKAITDAQKALEAKANKDELNKVINNAEGLTLDPTDKEDKAVQDALAKAKAVQADPNVSQDAVDAAKAALEDAINAKNAQDAKEAKAAADAKQAALDALKAELEKAKAINKDDYTPNSVKPLTDAETTGQAIVDAPDGKTTEEIEAATQALKDAQAGLVAKADKAELDKAINNAEGLTLYPTDKEDKAVQDALEKAKAVQANPNATQDEVNAAKDALNKAIEAKTVQDKADKVNAALGALKAELEKAKAINKNDYTPNSVKPLTDAETTGQAIVDAPDGKTTEEIEAATQALKDAQAGLVQKADKSELQNAIDKANAIDNLEANDKEDKAILDAVAAGEKVKVDGNATPQEVADATKAINDAIAAKEHQDALDELNKAIEDAKAVNKDDFKPNTVKPLEDAIKAGETAKADVTKTPEELKEAAKAINDAKNNLEAKANKDELNKAITEAEGLTLDPKDKEDKAVQDALDKAKAVLEDPNATQEAVDAAKNALNKAVEAKKAQDAKEAPEKQAALDALKAELEKAKSVDKDAYTPNSVKPLTDAVTVGQAIVDAPKDKTVEEIKKATQALKDAQAGLVAKADKAELDKAINNAEGLTLYPTDKEDKAVQDALEKAKAVQANPNATQDEVNAAKDALNKAIEAKTAQDKADAVNAALEALKVELEKAKAIKKDDYTPNSVKSLVDAIAVAQGIVNNPESVTVDQIKAATQALKDAQAGLVAKADKTELDKAIDNAEGLTLDPKDKEDKAVQEALENAKAVQADANATQTEVDAAKDALNKAVEAKATQDKADALAELQKALDKAQSTDKSKYTPESVEKLDVSVNTGKAIVENSEEVSIEDIQETTKAIEDALKALEVIKAPTIEKETDKVKSTSGKSVERTSDKSVERTSDKAVKKSEGSKAQTKANKAKVLPNTGQETLVDPKYATLMLAIGGLMALFGRRKKEDKDNTEK
ncbi:lectin-like domain-containing protein [Staphylococcus simulans]|uniref:lectin-like domain-containing protein n=1 Tax=Staphylococcus simulans TaxID=1286 RepID=UPI0021CF9CEB|nr:putative Ig domain-containing protein [Staphylococcus simulans]UXV43031.1 putative Ig domain-containing protein [Staphylococcus simulans]